MFAVAVLLAVCWPSPAAAHDVQLMARTAYFEARSDGARGMTAVCWVIKNRGGAVRDVVHSPAQFSVWNRGGAARTTAIPAGDPHYKMALRAARQVIKGSVRDPTRGATHYHEVSMRPAWTGAMIRTVRIGRHIFYRLGVSADR